ncbi:MAG: 23S rRNA (adenine(2503)-C(2))-methyltransferase RlmN [Clostridia bacterium]|nr:23S rRNA (adenine(2503)-C(2))-methyltransferase RlmN [Clostridia bacterium]
MDKIDIKSLPTPQLREQLTAKGIPAFRAGQIRSWLDRGVTDFSQMGNLPLSLREQLANEYMIPSVTVQKKWVSALDGTIKYLFALSDGELIESVLMQYHHGYSQCLSTQVGCRMGCTFCATGQEGLVRNLLPAEMLAQIEAAQVDAGVRVSSLVLMGMGEPLDNFDNVMRFLEMVNEEGGVQIGMRHISLSTCGLVDQIERLQEKNWQLTLSVSLHAPNDELRQQLMPIAKKWSVDELLAACRRYADATGRRVSFEYAMVDGVSDSDACARELAAKLRGTLCHVNLIPVNPVKGTPYRRSHAKRLESFCRILQQGGVNVTVRRTLGADIEASCGQLRRHALENNG